MTYALDSNILSYMIKKDKDIQKLMGYAEKLRVKPKVLNYMTVLL